MNLSYSLRLLFLCLASFFLIHTAVGLAVWFAARPLARFAGRLRPRVAARFLFLVRLAPVSIALASVLGICAPSYLRFEQNLLAEQAGIACLAFAALGSLIWAIALYRGVFAAITSAAFTRRCRERGQELELAGQPRPLFVIADTRAFLAQSGILRPRFVISRRLLNEFEPDEFAAALTHERAHWISRDNLKRLLLAFLPDIVPCLRSFRALESSWARFAERAADDYVAAEGDSRALSLAAALVRLARIGASTKAAAPTPLATSPLGGSDDLAGRVQRLLMPTPDRAAQSHLRPAFVGGATALAACCITALAWPAALSPVHELLERLLH